MKKKRRFISVLLCAAMLLGSMPAYFAGAEDAGTELETEEFSEQVLQADSDLSASVNEGLLAHLKFDDTVDDATGKGTPVLEGSATYEQGINGKAIRFDGASADNNSNRVELTGRDDLKFSEGDAFSVGFWYKADKTLSDNNIIGSKSWSNAANEGWNIALAGTKMNISPISRSKESDIQCTIEGINGSGKWMYAVITRTADAQNALYIDGKKVSTSARGKGSTGTKPVGNVCIGADYEGKYGPGNAVALDEVKMWNRALTAAEVQYLYQTSPEITAMSVSGPTTATVGESDTTVTLNAKVTKAVFGETEPVEPVSWTTDIGNEYIVSNGAQAQLTLPTSLTEGQTVTVTAKIGGHSASHTITISRNVVPDRLVIAGDAELVKPDGAVQKTYTAKWTDADGGEAAITDPENITWTLSGAAGVQINGAATGKTVTVDIPETISVGKTFTLTAAYKTFEGTLKVTIVPNREIPQAILDKVETQMEFDGNLDMVKGTQPTLEGTMTYQDGVEGKGAVFTYGNYLDFSNYDLANKTILFSLKSNKFTGVQDPCIWGNKDWNNANPKGFIFSYAYNTSSSFKSRIADGAQKNDVTFNYSPQYWSNYAINFDTANKKYSVYKDGQLVKEMDTAAFAANWQNGAYTLKLGNDGTGSYKWNNNKDSEYEFVVDKLMITGQVLTPQEILTVSEANKVVLTAEDKPEVTISAVGGEKIPSGQLFNVNIHAKGQKMGLAAKTEFDIKYDAEAVQYHGKQYAKSGITLTDDGAGTLHVAYAAAILNNEISEYSKSRIVQPIFEAKNLNQKKAMNLSIENIKCYDESGSEMETDGTGNGYPLEILPVNALDLNKDGVVGAGDIALATTEQQKQDIAAAAKIYPYKRALVITIDGGGKAYDPDRQYLCNESTNTYTVESDLGSLRPKDGYAMKLFNQEFAMSYTARATDPPISAQNYCAITHGIPWKSLPAGYQFTNDISGAKLWPDYGLETPLYPSIFQVIKTQQPERKLFATAEWNPITNGILEQNVGTYFQYRASSAANPLCFDQLEEYIQDGRFKDTALTYMQSDTMDHYGHASGYFTSGYYEELKQFDGHFKKIIDAMKAANAYDDTFFVVNSDHGGHRNANGTGSHGTTSLDVDMDIMIGARGQTVPAGKRLNGGDNKDIAAITLQALRVEKPASMNNSTVFDSSLFLTQEEMSSKGRTVEKVSFDMTGNTGTVSVSNLQSKEIKALDTVILLSGRTVSNVTPAGGVQVLRQSVQDDKLYLTIAGSNLNGTAATVTFSDGTGNCAIEEVMLGAADGSEIYCDLENLTNGAQTLTGTGEITGDAKIVKTDVSARKSYGVTFKKLSGEEMTVQPGDIHWSVTGAQGITLPENATGASAIVTVAANVASGTTFTLKAEYKGLIAQKEITVQKRPELPADIKAAIETKVTFDDGIKAEIGTTPTLTGPISYSDGIRGKSGVFTNGNYLDFGNYDLKNKTILFTLKSNSFTGVKDPVVIANKDWNNGNAKGFVWAYAWNEATKFKNRIADGSQKTDKTFTYTPKTWNNVALVFDSTGNSYKAYMNGEEIAAFNTVGYAANWENGGYSLKLGNDGTGKYSCNSNAESKYEFEIDDFMIVNKVLNAGEIAAVNEAQADAPEMIMQVNGASEIVTLQNAEETYTAVFSDEDGNAVNITDTQNISWTLEGAAGNVSIPANSKGKSVVLTAAAGAPDQTVTLRAVYSNGTDIICTTSKTVQVTSVSTAGNIKIAVLGDFQLKSNTAATVTDNIKTALQNYKAKNVDVIMIPGDITDDASAAGYDKMWAAFDAVYPDKATRPKIVSCMGNHDYWNGRFQTPQVPNDLPAAKALYKAKMGVELNTHDVVKGYHFISISPEDDSTHGLFTQASIDYLTAAIAQAEKEDPNKPIFVMAHQHVRKKVGDKETPTVYLSDEWGNAALYDAMKDHPQIVFLSGHSHAPIDDERSIHQEDFTSLGTSSMNYLELEKGKVGGTKPVGYNQRSQSLYMEVTPDEITIERWDKGKKMGSRPNWVIQQPATKAEFAYTNEKRNAARKAPEFASGAEITVGDLTENTVAITLPAATHDDFVHSYRVELKNKTNTSVADVNALYFSDFCKSVPNMAKTVSYTLSGLMPSTEYEINIYAIESFGKESKPLSKTITTPKGTIDPNDPKPAADVLNVTFDDGAAVDHSTFKTTLTPMMQSGGTAVSYSYDDTIGRTVMNCNNSALKAALNSTQMAKITNQYSIETVVKLDNVNKTQSIFANTESAGISLEISSTGRIEMWARVGNAYQKVGETENFVLKAGQYYHLMGTYNGSQLALYVDGQKIATKNASGAITYKNLPTYIGGDTNASGDIQAPIVGQIALARLYSIGLSEEQVKNIYNDYSNPTPAEPPVAATISGSASVTAPKGDTAQTANYTVAFQDKNGETVTISDTKNIAWSLEGAGSGVSIPQNSTGSGVQLSVTKEAAEQTVTLKAEYTPTGAAKITATLEISVKPHTEEPVEPIDPTKVETVEISGATAIRATNQQQREQYLARALNKNGGEVAGAAFEWTLVSSTASGVGLNSDGVLIVNASAGSGKVVIQATLKQDPKLKAQITVNITGSSNSGSGGGTGGGGGNRYGTASGNSAVVLPPTGTNTNPSQNPQVEYVGGFKDMPRTHWASASAQTLLNKGIIGGDAEGGLRPDANITREEAVKVLLLTLEKEVQPTEGSIDENTSQWAKDYMLSANGTGVIKGDENGKFNGRDAISRIDAMVIIARALQLEAGATETLSQFTDGAEIPDYAKAAVAKLVELGIVKGYTDGSIGVNNNITRAELFTLMTRIMK